MLEFSAIAPQFAELAQSVSAQAEIKRGQLETALALVSVDDATWSAHLAKIKASKPKWLVGVPLDHCPPFQAIRPVPIGVPTPYTAMATDGSQIPLDRHEAAPCYVINVGRIALHYGTGERPLMDSQPQMFFRDEDMLVESSDGEAAELSYITERDVATKRFLAEMNALGDLIDQFSGRPDCVAFVDGTLILWAQEARSDDSKREALKVFLDVLEKARSKRVPVVGYLSRPSSREVIGALRVVLGESEPAELPTADAQSGSINRLTDADLFKRLLAPGQRCGLFESRSKILKEYSPAEQRIVFCYINTGAEIARLEIPRWVADDALLSERCHVLAVDQAAKGRGYPVCLSEAHEMAVIRAPERAAFYSMVERAMIGAHIPVVRTAKAAAKRRRSV